MRRAFMGVLLTAVLTTWLAGPVAAAPDNENTKGIDVSCDGLEITGVSFIEQASGASAFVDGGGVIVARGFTDMAEAVTFTVVGSDPVISGTANFTDPGGVKPGNGAAAALYPCAFTDTYTFLGVVEAADVEWMDIEAPLTGDSWENYVGESVRIAGAFSGTAWVMLTSAR